MKKVDYLSTLFVGIDIGARQNVVSAINFEQEFFIKMKPVPNTQSGAEQLESMLVKILENNIFKVTIIGLESTSFYGVHIANFLSASEKLVPYKPYVYCLNPKEVANYKDSFNALNKNDGIDSFVIADFARVGRIHTEPWRGSQYLALQRLTRHRLHIVECLTREKTYMLSNVFLKFSEFALLDGEEHPFSNKYGATASSILTDFLSSEDIANASIEELVEFINTKSRKRISDPQMTAKILQQAARNSYRLDKCLYEPLTTSIACSFNCIQAFEKELSTINKAIEKAVMGMNPVEYQILMSIPGFGPVYSSGILAELGSVHAFPNNDAIAKYAGIVWKENQSGDFKAENTPMNKAGNRYLRYYLIEAAGSVIRHVPEYQAFYQKKFAEVTTHQHKRALALTSRKLIRLIFGLLAKNQLYSSNRVD
ncbi:IS110 family transposase [Clostridium sp. JN-9]|uniref:IS110 family transposase n=1 Tax=Clostridium sp. JN-9 TaxID=2507159 RepID=UPI000FFE2621|nr:IS110 family transposase [Clostridium sp. JN-9]QAT39084.1 IS110 family transposase [Clostridium sp. JN-9]QAT39143.1 IS110 family transposase [Clostridium sp. JN-9]QAT39184.1 IS110 family transposase [Clostridium sp. JN-9]QAT39560.1 IS110 family transposase [Clostridium sp. JN-9]QAT39569.1 IS110 family transposase [Clostridium sp. JN-9]